MGTSVSPCNLVLFWFVFSSPLIFSVTFKVWRCRVTL